MQPILMTLLLVGSFGFFGWTALRRLKLLTTAPAANRFDRIPERVMAALKFSIGQARMTRYRWSGVAHILVFGGFMVLLLRSIILWGRGYDESFNLFLFAPDQPLGIIYALLKDTFVLLVIAGVSIFFYYRGIRRERRLTLTTEGLIILGIIFTMMATDVLYDAARMVRTDQYYPIEYVGYALSSVLTALPDGPLRAVEHFGFWTHATLVLVFLNLLPYSKHFHVITAIPNTFHMNLDAPGKLPKIEDIEGKLEREETLGAATLDQLDWKSRLDMFTCTECGRCSDWCPATNTGKLLSPKHLMTDLRNHLYDRQDEILKLSGPDAKLEPIALVSDDLIKPEVIWACTTCRACEQECPVMITYVDKIVDMRRNLVMEQSAFPDELQNLFNGIENAANPWSYPADDRLAWTEGLDVPEISDHPDADVLLWVGCAPAFDARARKVTRATVRLLQEAGVKFAVLGLEECCTGDPARRAGHEFLFQMMAEQNVETLNGYEVKKILTSCPHCFNTLANEYPDFGGTFEVLHHTDFLFDLVRQGKLKPNNRVDATVTYHDSCYLGRYNEIYDSPREILKSIPGVTLVEAEASRDRGMCCGAGGAQMFKEDEPGDERVNLRRTDQLLGALDNASGGIALPVLPTNGAQNGAAEGSQNGNQSSAEHGDSGNIVASACPFCMRMLTDGLAGRDREQVEQIDVAEALCRSVLGDE